MDCRPPDSSVHQGSLGKTIRVGCHAFLQGILPTQGLNPGLPYCRLILYHLRHQGPRCQRTDTFELWCWRRLLRVPWTSRSNQSILKEISPKYSLEGLMLKLKHQYFGHLMQRAKSLEKTLMLGKIEGRRRRGWQRKRRLDSITNSLDMNLSKLLEIVNLREVCRAVVHGVTKDRTRLRD